MDLAFKPPVVMIVILGAVVLAAVLALFLKRTETWKKVLTVVLTLGACGAAFLFVLGTRHLVVDEAGIHAGMNGRQSISWTSVSRAVLVENLASSPWAPVRKTTGTSFGKLKSGWFRLADGSTAFLMVETPGRALVVQGNGKTLVLAPAALDALASEVAKHVPVERGGGAS